eukprot:GEMP01022919.1.p1 GENE.GEMP01022919.1~~GEMP01022919.1.p1  ORF type:complete len:297 (+),score=89.11 GEMP01022919.1:431-1321(+)
MTLVQHLQDVELAQHLKDIRKELTKLYAEPDVRRMLDEQNEVQKLKERVAELRADLARQTSEDAAVKDDINELRQENAMLMENNRKLKEELAAAMQQSVSAALAEVQRENERLAKDNENLNKNLDAMQVDRDKLARLEAQGYFDPEVTKVLHLNPALRKSLLREDEGSEERSVDDATRNLLRDKCLALEHSEANVEKLKLAFTKMTDKFRDGISELLGWRIEQLADGQWSVMSKYHPKEGKLLFQQTEEGFELLDSPWAQRLQEDGEAIAFLRMFNSIPSFLAYIVQDRIQTKTLV